MSKVKCAAGSINEAIQAHFFFLALVFSLMHISLDVDANITIMILLDYYQALRNSTDRLNKGGGRTPFTRTGTRERK